MTLTPLIETVETEAEAGGDPDGRLASADFASIPTLPPNPRRRDPWPALAGLVVLGGASNLAYYFGFVRPYQLSEYYQKPLLDLAKINGYTADAANWWALTWIALFALYYLAFRLCPSAESVSRAFRWATLATITGWAALFCVNLIFMYPVGAADIFDQIFRARLLSNYGLNPFTTLPSSLEGDPFQQYVAWTGAPSPYGPMWEILAGLTSGLAGDNLWNNLILFKLLVTVPFGINIALTYGILRAVNPDWTLRGTLFFAWNPLVLFEVPGNGHNDSLVVLFLLLAVFLFVRARRSAIIPALMAGALTKFVPILLILPAATAIWRDRRKTKDEEPALSLPKGRRACPELAEGTKDEGTEDEGQSALGDRGARSQTEVVWTLAIGALLSVGMALVLYAPFWVGPESVGALGRQSLFTASLPKVMLDVLVSDLGVNSRLAQSIVSFSALALVGIVTLILSVRIFRRANANSEEERHALIASTLSAFYEILFVYLAFATLWFQPWYLMWLVALTAPVARIANIHRTLLFCIGGVANYFVWDFIWLWNRTEIRNIQITAAIAVYTLPLFYTLYIWLKPRFDRLSESVS